jgi:hypothetical protein
MVYRRRFNSVDLTGRTLYPTTLSNLYNLEHEIRKTGVAAGCGTCLGGRN